MQGDPVELHLKDFTSARSFRLGGSRKEIANMIFCAYDRTGLTASALHHWAEGHNCREANTRKALLITLIEQEYVSAPELASSGAIVGAGVYDALIAYCALKAGADILLASM